jgi:hypothetical protein
MVCLRVRRVAPTVPPRTGQGAEGGRVDPNQVALVEGTAVGRKCGGSGERGLARCGRGLRATTGGIARAGRSRRSQRSGRKWLWRRGRSPPSPAAPRRWRWRSRTTTPHRPGGTSGQACPRQPPSPRRGRSLDGGTAIWWLGARGAALRLLLPAPPPPSFGRGVCRRPPPFFADAQEEQQLWEKLRDHGASLNRALNEALRIHGGPAWRIFQVRCCCFFL